MEPIIQLSIDTENLNKALKIVEDTNNQGVEWVEIGPQLIRNHGLNVIRTFKKRFPKKKLVVALDTLSPEKDIKDKVNAGADIILIPEISNIDSLRKHITLSKERGAKAMTYVNGLSPFEERSMILQGLGIDYILINLPDDRILYDNEFTERIKRVSTSLKIPIGVDKNINQDNVKNALKSGAEIIVVSKAITEVEDSKKAVKAIKRILDDEGGKGIVDNAIDVLSMVDEREVDAEIDEYLDFGFIELDLDKMKEKCRVFGKRRDAELKRLEGMKQRIIELDKFKKESYTLRKELSRFEEIRNKEKKDLEKEKDVLKEDVRRLEELREIENTKIEVERKTIDEEFTKLGREWKRLKDAEDGWNEKQRVMESEFKRRQEETWGEWEEEQRKRFKEYAFMREDDKRKTYKEMQRIEKRWDELNEIVKRLGEEKTRLSEDRRGIKDEWGRIGGEISVLKDEQKKLDRLKRELEENKEKVVGELEGRIDQSITYLPKLVSRVSEIYREKEQELRKLRSQRQIIDDKMKLINNKWSEIEKLEREGDKDKGLIKRDRKQIKDELSKIEQDLSQLKREHEGDMGKNAVERLRGDGLDPKPLTEKTGDAEVEGGVGKSLEEPVKKTVEEHLKNLKLMGGKPEKKNLSEEDIKKKELISSLIHLISKKGEVGLDEAAEILDVDKDMVNRWSRLLEDRGLIVVDKKLFGGTILKEGLAMHKLT